jgi:hypothetical protein
MHITYTIKGKTVLIDEEDKGLFESYRWFLMPARQIKETYYLYTQVNRKTVYLHRLIANAGKGQIVDHENRNTLDCTRKNLRVVTGTINRINCEVRLNKKSSQYKGVFKSKSPSKPFCSMIGVNGKRVYIGSFATEFEAACAYNTKMKEMYPEVSQPST